MDQSSWQNVWDGVIDTPVSTRLQKPRNCGWTMVMDKGMGLGETSELLSVAGRYIDYVKLAFGTSALYNGYILREKIALIRSLDIDVYPGGTFFEIAIMQDKMDHFLELAQELNFSAIEVSDGTITMSSDTRLQAIKSAAKAGFRVLSEVGKKDPLEYLTPDTIAAQINFDLAAGASKVILEARESGLGIGIFGDKGEIREECVEHILAKIPDFNCILWEAPLKKQQQELILRFGPNVNLGNIPPAEALALESLRVGLRSDTFKPLIERYLCGTLK